jgi:quercetin dioxygenase-like cupin family protein
MSYLLDPQTIPWQSHPRFQGASLRPLITPDQNPGLTVSQVRLLPGSELPPHSHPASAETFFVLAGAVWCRVGQDERLLRQGEIGHAPPGVVHQVRNPGPDPAEALSIFNPPLS